MASQHGDGLAVVSDSTGFVSAGVEGGTLSVGQMLSLSLLAGLATGVGGALVVFLGPHPSPTHMALMLSFAAGVMTSVSIVDMWLPQLAEGVSTGTLPAVLFWSCVQMLLGGLAFIALNAALPDNLEPPAMLGGRASAASSAVLPTTNPAPASAMAAGSSAKRHAKPGTSSTWRLSVVMMLTLTAHNLPEGIAVAVSSMESVRTGAVMAVAIALHNIPEGLVIAAPVLAATGSKLAAVGMALVSGLSEPVGALLATCILKPVFGIRSGDLRIVLNMVAGVMLCVSGRELMAQALRYAPSRFAVTGFCAGAAAMAVIVVVTED